MSEKKARRKNAKIIVLTVIAVLIASLCAIAGVLAKTDTAYGKIYVNDLCVGKKNTADIKMCIRDRDNSGVSESFKTYIFNLVLLFLWPIIFFNFNNCLFYTSKDLCFILLMPFAMTVIFVISSHKTVKSASLSDSLFTFRISPLALLIILYCSLITANFSVTEIALHIACFFKYTPKKVFLHKNPSKSIFLCF